MDENKYLLNGVLLGHWYSLFLQGYGPYCVCGSLWFRKWDVGLCSGWCHFYLIMETVCKKTIHRASAG